MTTANAVPAVTLDDEFAVSAIGFGAMALTPVYGEVDDTESLATLHHCLDLDVTFIDTANVYGGGNNERLIANYSPTAATRSRWQPNSALQATRPIGQPAGPVFVGTPPMHASASMRASPG